MANTYFSFKQFTVNQDRTAMKVGTDGVLLGLLSTVPCSDAQVLDIGTGTGLVSLLLAQRFPDAVFDAIDIDSEAVKQAQENFAQSPFAPRLTAFEADINSFISSKKYNLIVSNPPFFVDATHCPDIRRTTARHNIAFSFEKMIANSRKMLADNGLLSLIIPTDFQDSLIAMCQAESLFLASKTVIFPNRVKPSKRTVLTFSLYKVVNVEMSSLTLEESPRVKTQEFSELVKDFYLDR